MPHIISLRKGTSTDRATQYLLLSNPLFKEYGVIYINSFEEGTEWMKKNATEHDRLLVPDVADIYRGLVMNQQFECDTANSFWYQNPPLYLAKRNGSYEIKTCALLPVLKNLLSDSFVFIHTNNTQESAELCKVGKADTCVTNQHGLDMNELEIVKKLKSSNIYWVPFKKI